MNEVKKHFAKIETEKIVEILKNHDYNAMYADNLSEAKQMVLDMIPQGSSISVGGSVTLADMDMPEVFRNDKYNFIERYKVDSFDKMVEAYRQGLLADVMVTSANAVTKNGEIICLDCSGNRAAGMIFGPKKVIIIMGYNKIVDTLEEGMKRAKSVAPLNAKRLNHDTPCTITGKCENCRGGSRMCNAFAILTSGVKFEGRVNIIMVAEEAGY